MNILESILGGAGGDTVTQLAQRFGIAPEQARAAVESLVPQLAGGLTRNASSPGGLESLLGALQRGGHERFVDDPATIAQPQTIDAGNGILAHILGNKETSRGVAQQASARTGLDVGILKQMLPVLATVVMGHLAKKQAGGAAPTDLLGSLGGLSGMLDADRDGKVEVSDVIGLAKKIF